MSVTVNEQSERQKAYAYFETLGLRGITALKLMNVLGEKAAVAYVQSDDSAIGVIRYKAEDFSYDRVHYPDANAVVVAAGNAAGELRAQLKKEMPGIYIVKGTPELVVAAIHGQFSYSLVQTIYSYSPDHTRQTHLAECGAKFAVHRSTGLREDLLQIFALVEYDREGIQQLLEHDGSVYWVEESGKALSVCAGFHNHGNLYEIGAVATLPEQRGKGLARIVVSAALHDLAERKKEVRYNVVSSNSSSIKVAESLGMNRVLEYGHYMVTI